MKNRKVEIQGSLAKQFQLRHYKCTVCMDFSLLPWICLKTAALVSNGFLVLENLN